jgi:hypothetical protein
MTSRPTRRRSRWTPDLRRADVEPDQVVVPCARQERLAQAAERDRIPLRHGHVDCRGQHAPERDVGHPWRLGEAPPRRVEVCTQDVGAAQILEQRQHLPVREPYVAFHIDAVHPQEGRGHHERDALLYAKDQERDAETPRREPPREQRPDPTSAPRCGTRAPEVRLRARSDPHRSPPSPGCAWARSAARMASAAVPIEPAPSVITRSPGLTMRATACGTSSSRGTTWGGRPAAASVRSAKASRVAPGIAASPAAIDVGQHHLVGGGERPRERVRAVARAGIAVRLEHQHEAPAAHACGLDDGPDLGGVVAVVVDDRHPPGVSPALEPPLGAVKLRKRLGGPREGHLQLERHGDRPQGVQQVVPSRHRQPSGARAPGARGRALRHEAARAERLERHAVSGHVGRRQAFPLEPVGDDAAASRAAAGSRTASSSHAEHHGAVERHLVGELDERLCRPPELP